MKRYIDDIAINKLIIAYESIRDIQKEFNSSIHDTEKTVDVLMRRSILLDLLLNDKDISRFIGDLKKSRSNDD